MIEPQIPGNCKVLLRHNRETAPQPLPVSFCSLVQINPGEPGGVVTADPVVAGKVGQEVSVRAGHLILDQRPGFGDPVDLASREMLHQLCFTPKIAQIYPVNRRLSPDIATISPLSPVTSQLPTFHPAQAVRSRPDRVPAQAGSVIR